MESRDRAGFTLIEVLIVIAIIVLLCAVALPAMHGARERATRDVCSSQVHQLSLAVWMYFEENNDRPLEVSYLPSVSPSPVKSDQAIYLADVLLPYVSDHARVFHCPKDIPGWSERDPPARDKSYFDSERSSYYWTGLWIEGYEAFHFGHHCRDLSPPAR
jgi:prepilin-type N-terminal cleavage/methylation domain-containing protein